MFWKRDHRVIEVEMFDARTSALLSRMKLPIDRLPESFEAETTMHVKERDYSVVKAVPMTAAEFRRSGKLKLLLRQANLQTADPRGLLFSLPTICQAIAPIEPGSTKLNKAVIELHEDDWRQREFVSLTHQNQIDQHLFEIRRIYEQQRVGSGFKKSTFAMALPNRSARNGRRSPKSPGRPTSAQRCWMESLIAASPASLIPVSRYGCSAASNCTEPARTVTSPSSASATST